MKSEGLYVYCIARASVATNLGPIGIGDRGDVVSSISYRDVDAVVSNLPMDRYEVSQKTMLAHQRVMEKVMACGTLLPVRFYTVAPNAEDVRNLLRQRYREFLRLLREMDNKVELGLKAFWKDVGPAMRAAAEKGAGEKSAGGGPDEVAEAARSFQLALDEERLRWAKQMLGLLTPLAVDWRLHQTFGDAMIVNAVFLVDRWWEKEFDARVAEFGRDHGDRVYFKYVGPAPPYSFVNVVVKQEQGTASERR